MKEQPPQQTSEQKYTSFCSFLETVTKVSSNDLNKLSQSGVTMNITATILQSPKTMRIYIGLKPYSEIKKYWGSI